MGNSSISKNLVAQTSYPTTPVPVSDGGTGQITAQAAINILASVAAATNEHVMTKDTATGNVLFKGLPSTTKVAMGLFNRDASLANEDVAFTGIGFTPKAILIHAVQGGAVGASLGWSTGFGTDLVLGTNTNNTQQGASGYCVFIRSNTGTGDPRHYALLRSFDADGFTIGFVRGDGVTGTFTHIYLVIG